MEKENSIRAFIAIDLPQQIKSTFLAINESLKIRHSTKIRWVNVQNIHLTLKFLGHINANLVASITDSMSSATEDINPFNLCLGHLMLLPTPHNPKTLSMSVSGDLTILRQVQESVERQIGALGFAKNQRVFRPHITIARFKDNLSTISHKRIQEEAILQDKTWTVTELVLIKSTFTPNGPIYQKLCVQALGKYRKNKII